MDEYQLLDRLERVAASLGEERALRQIAERKADTSVVSGAPVVELLDALAGKRLIDAIKLYRQLTGWGLKESKNAIERVTSQFGPVWNDD